MQQEVRARVAVQGVDDLLVVAGAQSGHNQTLSFAAGEQSRTVGTGQDANFGRDRANVGVRTAVDTCAAIDDVAAQDRAFQFLERRTQVAVFQLFLGQGCFHSVTCRSYCVDALLLVLDREGCAHLVFASGFDLGVQFAVVGRDEVEGLFRALFSQADD